MMTKPLYGYVYAFPGPVVLTKLNQDKDGTVMVENNT